MLRHRTGSHLRHIIKAQEQHRSNGERDIMSSPAKEIEKKSLEAHVELCAERYSTLEEKLDSLESRMGKIEHHIVDIKDSIGKVGIEGNKTLITVGTSVIGVLLTAVIGLLVHLIMK